MKKRLAMLAALLMLVWTGASADGADLSWDQAVSMAEYMRELATGDYLDIKQVAETQQTVAASWAEGITGAPRMVVQLDINALTDMVDTRLYFSQEPEMVSYEAESSTMALVWQYLVYYASQEAALTESSYEEILEINGQINAARMYAGEGTQGNAMYIVLYENATPIVLLVNAENGAVSIQGMFLPSARLAKCANYGQVALWLMLNGFSMSCSEVLPE